MSNHCVSIVEIDKIEPHPNADALEIVRIKGWQTCVRLGDFSVGDKAIWIEPDYNVPLSNPLFSFLKNKDNEGRTFERIRVRKLRKVISQGLLIKVPDELSRFPVGSNVVDLLGIERYEPPMPTSSYASFDSCPSDLYVPVFDVENWQNYPDVFTNKEPVIIGEKLHGSSSRYVWSTDKNGVARFFMGSRKNWVKDDNKNWWCVTAKQHPEIEQWCRLHPDTILYGEIYGPTQYLKYGTKPGEFKFACFAMLNDGAWIDYDECVRLLINSGIDMVPLIYRGELNIGDLESLSEGNSTLAPHIREGIVIIPEHERQCDQLPNNRVCLKVVSSQYLAKS